MKTFKFRFDLGESFSPSKIGHEGSRGYGNRASGTLKGDIRHPAFGQVQEDNKLVAANGIVAIGVVIGFLDHSKIARLSVVIKNGCLVELSKFVHQPKISRVSPRAAARASISAGVL